MADFMKVDMSRLGQAEGRSADSGMAAPSEGVDTGELEVTLTFELERRLMTVRDVETLAPGYTFAFGGDALAPVTLYANGKSVGKGRLVDLNGTLSVPASLEQLANVNAFIHETIPSSYRPLIPQVELAAEELLVNVFSYAYPDVPGEAQVACREVRLDNVPYFCFKVQDWGAPFDPFLEAPVPDVSLGVDERPVGGLGIHLIKSVVAHYTYAYYEQSNIIELYFALPE